MISHTSPWVIGLLIFVVAGSFATSAKTTTQQAGEKLSVQCSEKNIPIINITKAEYIHGDCSSVADDVKRLCHHKRADCSLIVPQVLSNDCPNHSQHLTIQYDCQAAFPVAECPAANDNVVTFESVCYEFMEHVATWEDAKKICIRQGWSVFKRTEHTEEPLVDYLQSQLLEKEWQKSVWAGKEGDSCYEWRYQNENRNWSKYDVPNCSYKFRFICEHDVPVHLGPLSRPLSIAISVAVILGVLVLVLVMVLVFIQHRRRERFLPPDMDEPTHVPTEGLYYEESIISHSESSTQVHKTKKRASNLCDTSVHDDIGRPTKRGGEDFSDTVHYDEIEDPHKTTATEHHGIPELDRMIKPVITDNTMESYEFIDPNTPTNMTNELTGSQVERSAPLANSECSDTEEMSHEYSNTEEMSHECSNTEEINQECSDTEAMSHECSKTEEVDNGISDSEDHLDAIYSNGTNKTFQRTSENDIRPEKKPQPLPKPSTMSKLQDELQIYLAGKANLDQIKRPQRPENTSARHEVSSDLVMMENTIYDT